MAVSDFEEASQVIKIISGEVVGSSKRESIVRRNQAAGSGGLRKPAGMKGLYQRSQLGH
jgi:hypothetical protein